MPKKSHLFLHHGIHPLGSFLYSLLSTVIEENYYSTEIQTLLCCFRLFVEFKLRQITANLVDRISAESVIHFNDNYVTKPIVVALNEHDNLVAIQILY